MGWRSLCISCYMGFIIICLWTSEFRWIVTFCLSLFLEYKRGRKLTVGAHCRLRLVMPPTLFFILETPFTQLAHVIFPKAMANGVITGAFAFCKSRQVFHWGRCSPGFEAHRVTLFSFSLCFCYDGRPTTDDRTDVLYDMVHYFSHHMRVSEGYLADMKKYHLAHHYQSESHILSVMAVRFRAGRITY
jgi:hypothetical protein